MSDPVATPADVKVHIPTKLEDDEIDSVLEFAAREDARKNGGTRESRPEEDTKDLEAAFAALRIVTTVERQESWRQLGSGTKAFEAIDVNELRAIVGSLDESGQMIGGVLRNTSRYSGSV